MLKEIDWVKSALLLGMALCVLLLLREWDDFTAHRDALIGEHSNHQTVVDISVPEDDARASSLPPSTDSQGPTYSNSSGDSEEFPEIVTADTSWAPATTIDPSSNLISVKTDVLLIELDPRGGDIVSARLVDYKIAAGSDQPYTLLTASNEHTYVAKSGLLGPDGTDTAAGRPLFSSADRSYSLGENEDELVVDLHFQQADINITKRFSLQRSNYLIDVEYLIDNRSGQTWNAAFYAQINRDDQLPDTDAGFGMNPYVGAALTTAEERYKKVEFEDIEDGRFQKTVDAGWVALLERYFLSAWIPQEGLAVSYDLRKSSGRNLYYIGFTQPLTRVNPDETGVIKAGFYVGPKDQYALRDIARYLDLTVDYGWLWWAAQPLYAVLYFIQSGEIQSFDLDLKIFPGFTNWGVSIILLTVIVKLIFFPLSAASYRSMARMRKLTPKMTAMRERFGDDKQAMSQEIMRLYQKEKVNPLGGCLPMLVQMPIFLALYWVLLESVEIRQAPFALWLQDLSSKDPWFVLPLIMGASMWFQQKLSPPPPDPTQARVMQMMPIMFTFMFLFFPSGLVLYWTVNNILSITQQWLITRNMERGAAT